jgi:hypothetical protein
LAAARNGYPWSIKDFTNCEQQSNTVQIFARSDSGSQKFQAAL